MGMLPQSFFAKDVLLLAQDLLGCTLVHETKDGVVAGIIVETEAYHQEDEASHSFRGKTARTQVMFGPAGYAYVYFTYGRHYCFNIVAGESGVGEAVLIRALEPIHGLDIMKQQRGRENIKDLCNGPAKLVQAMSITKADYGKPLFEGSLFIKSRDEATKLTIRSGPRIGIKKAVDKPWRFWLDGSEFTSR